MAEDDRRDAFEVLKTPFHHERGDEEKRRSFRLMGFSVALALLVTLAMPWLTTWDDRAESPTRIYSGISLIQPPDPGGITRLPQDVFTGFLFGVYVLAALICLVLPATLSALVSSGAGLVVSVTILVVNRDTYDGPPLGGNVHHADWTGASTVAIGLWLVALFVSTAGWWYRRRSSHT